MYIVIHDKWNEEFQKYNAEIYPNLTECNIEDQVEALGLKVEANDVVSICKVISETVY